MSEEILDVNCGNKHGSIDHSDRECPHDVKKLEIRQSDAELRGPLTAPCDGGMDSNKCGPESASKPTGSDEVEQDVRCNGENTSDGEQCGSNKINLPVGSGTKQTAKDCNISEESQSIKRKANINKSSTVNSCDTDAESAEVKAIVTVNDDIDLSGNALNNAGLSTASTETKTKMKVKEPSIGELVLNDEKRVNGEDGSLEQGSSNKRVYHRHSRGSISSETGSVGSDTGERKSKRVSRPPPNTAPNPCGKRNCGSSEEIIVLDSAEEKAQEGKAEVNGSKSGEDVIKPKRRYRRRKTNVSANSTATEDSDTEDNLSLALLRYQEKTPAAPELDTNGRRNKASSAASSGFIQEVGKQPHGKGQSSCTSSSESHGSESGRGNHDNPMEGNSQDVLSKFQASQQVTVQSSPQKRMEQLLGQGEKNKPSTSKALESHCHPVVRRNR
ncbi:hypothetical protein LSH36_168g03073 [Paralvinella palmiformis]|uniref:Uncharacterized protein n=1 Tax=Paralvinella palmiformis TaxID=53620 RepID=A0AAD9N901_9ANNE|nr:hypothetical protein LSH36_168g03073 [Paralvinella palmiformis]